MATDDLTHGKASSPVGAIHRASGAPLRRWKPALLLALMAFLAGRAMAQAPVGTLIGVTGNATVKRGPQTIIASRAMPLMIGDKLQTSGGAELKIALSDGSQLTLAESSVLVIDRSVIGPTSANSSINLLGGKLRSVIAKRLGNAPIFEVHTPNAVAGVRGTDFETAYIVGKPCPGFPQCFNYTDVGVYEGIVEVSNPTSHKPVAVRVSGGYEAKVPCDLPPTNPGPLGMSDLAAPGYH